MNPIQLAMVALMVITAILCLLAYFGLKGGQVLVRRPLRLPKGHQPRHSRERGEETTKRLAPPRPPREQLRTGLPAETPAWLSSEKSQGWWIWNSEPAKPREPSEVE